MHCPAPRMPPPLRATVACLMLLVKGVLETIYCSKQTKGVSLAVSFPFFFFYGGGKTCRSLCVCGYVNAGWALSQHIK